MRTNKIKKNISKQAKKKKYKCFYFKIKFQRTRLLRSDKITHFRKYFENIVFLFVDIVIAVVGGGLKYNYKY